MAMFNSYVQLPEGNGSSRDFMGVIVAFIGFLIGFHGGSMKSYLSVNVCIDVENPWGRHQTVSIP